MTEVPPDADVEGAIEDAEESSAEHSGSPHTTPQEGHPAGEGERSDRDIGGPTSPEHGEGGATGGAHGTREGGFEPHE